MPNNTTAPAKRTISYKAGTAAVLAMSAASAGADVIVTNEFNGWTEYNGWDPDYLAVQTTVGKDSYFTTSLDVDHNGTIDFTYTRAVTWAGLSQPHVSSLPRLDYYDTAIYASGLGVANAVAPGSLIGPALDMHTSERLAYTNSWYRFYSVDNFNSGDCKQGSCSRGVAELVYESHDERLFAYHVLEGFNNRHVYLPFSFLDGKQTNYGWVELTIPFGYANYPLTKITSVGYDNTGAAVAAGAAASTTEVPEPSSLVMLATGLAGLSAYRGASRAARRRRPQA